MNAYVSPKQSAYCPECRICPQQERTHNPGERLCSSGHVFTLAQSKEALRRDRSRRKIKNDGTGFECDCPVSIAYAALQPKAEQEQE